MNSQETLKGWMIKRKMQPTAHKSERASERSSCRDRTRIPVRDECCSLEGQLHQAQPEANTLHSLQLPHRVTLSISILTSLLASCPTVTTVTSPKQEATVPCHHGIMTYLDMITHGRQVIDEHHGREFLYPNATLTASINLNSPWCSSSRLLNSHVAHDFNTLRAPKRTVDQPMETKIK